MVQVSCVHRDVAEYPVVRLAIQFRADHPLVSGITALQIQDDPQAGDADDCSRLPLQEWGGGAAGRRASRPESGGGGMWRGGRGSAKSAAGEGLRRQR